MMFLLVNRVGENWPLYDILNQFKKGQSHMAVVLKSKENIRTAATNTEGTSYFHSKLFRPRLSKVQTYGICCPYD
jgi:hypothetical protein